MGVPWSPLPSDLLRVSLWGEGIWAPCPPTPLQILCMYIEYLNGDDSVTFWTRFQPKGYIKSILYYIFNILNGKYLGNYGNWLLVMIYYGKIDWKLLYNFYNLGICTCKRTRRKIVNLYIFYFRDQNMHMHEPNIDLSPNIYYLTHILGFFLPFP